MSAVLYIHGKGGAAAESERYGPLFPASRVVGLDYRGTAPWEVGPQIRAAVKDLQAQEGTVILIANSIGAFFSLHAGVDAMLEQAYFISPVVDMEAMILALLRQANATEAALEREGEIETAFGETLSWTYLCYVRSHPIVWRAPTQILCGQNDALVPLETIRAFAQKHGAGLTVMEGGEHWFHTPAQTAFLDRWLTQREAARHAAGQTIETPRLRLRLASKEQMEAMIAAEPDPALRQAYSEMLAGCLQHPEQWAWYGIWMIERKDGTPLGDLSFKGLGATGEAEIGYGILQAQQGFGYATEAVKAACDWALSQSGVTAIEAETAPDNRASQRVLEKCGFVANGTIGEEGPRYTKRREAR